MSSGRWPIASPPGSATTARLHRPTSGPSTHTEARSLPTDGEVGLVVELGRRGDGDGRAVHHDVAAQVAQHVRHQRHVQDLRAVGERGRALGQQGRGHQLQHAVLGADHVDRADQPCPALDPEVLAQPVSPSVFDPARAADHRTETRKALWSGYVRAPDPHLHPCRRRRHHRARRLLPGAQDLAAAGRLRRRRRGERQHRSGHRTRSVARGAPGVAPQDPERPFRRRSRPLHAHRARPASIPLQRITQSYVDRLEGWCDQYNADLPALDVVHPQRRHARRRRCCTRPAPCPGGPSGPPGP